MTHPSPDEFIKSKSDQWRLDRTVTIRGNGSEPRKYEREAFTWLPETGSDDCVYVVERLTNPERLTQVRIAYWVVSRHGTMKDRWVFGRFAPMLPQGDLGRLMEKAMEEGTIK